MKTTLRNKIKNTKRKSGNKQYNGRCVTISKTCHEKKVAYSHNIIEDGKYVLLNKDGTANLLRLGEGLQSPVPIMDKHLLRHLQHV
jgi:hypothetical protein